MVLLGTSRACSSREHRKNAASRDCCKASVVTPLARRQPSTGLGAPPRACRLGSKNPWIQWDLLPGKRVERCRSSFPPKHRSRLPVTLFQICYRVGEKARFVARLTMFQDFFFLVIAILFLSLGLAGRGSLFSLQTAPRLQLWL